MNNLIRMLCLYVFSAGILLADSKKNIITFEYIISNTKEINDVYLVESYEFKSKPNTKIIKLSDVDVKKIINLLSLSKYDKHGAESYMIEPSIQGQNGIIIVSLKDGKLFALRKKSNFIKKNGLELLTVSFFSYEKNEYSISSQVVKNGFGGLITPNNLLDLIKREK